MTFTRKPGLHDAWVILPAACVPGIVSRADSASFAAFIDPRVEKFGWKRGDISFACALAFLAAMPAMIDMGWLGGVIFDVSCPCTWAIPASAAMGHLGLPLALYLPRHRKSIVFGSKAAGTT